MVDWTHVLVALVTGLPATIAALGAIWAAIQNGNKVDKVEEKVDQNTKITKEGQESVVVNAQTAANSAADAKEAVEKIDKKLNGGIDAAIEAAIAPMAQTFADHAVKDEKNIQEVTMRIQGLEQYIHLRNDDLLNAITTVSNNVNILLEIERQRSAKTESK